ncbi:MAG: helix-turn-helix domain-containing protein [Treponema sp.]|nr:helix-turn-helix domain-containing protein [Treponema sp.]
MANEFYESVKRGLEQALAYERGNKDAAKSTVVSVTALPEYSGQQVKAIRENLGLTQRVFAYVVGVSQKTVEAWESSRNIPQGPAQRFLALMDAGGRDFLNQYHLINS